MKKTQKIYQACNTVARDVAQGFLAVSHNGFALVGLSVMFVVITLVAHPEVRQESEMRLMNWLQNRQVAITGLASDPEAIERVTATNLKELPKRQAALALWISKKYSVAPEPIGALVAEAYDIGERTKIDPTLLLAVMAVESSFNPFAQSSVGAQGLMQVMTKVHSDKYKHFGGQYAAFDPVTNLRVGARILQEYIQRTGSVEGGLKYYVGAANMEGDGGYGAKVLAEYNRMHMVANGRAAPVRVPEPSAPRIIPVFQPTEEPGTPPVTSENVASLDKS